MDEQEHKLKHYIAMNGTRGCLPDSCSAYETKQAAIEWLTELLELTEEQAAELERVNFVPCTDEQGAEYAEITECTCLKPWEHGDGQDTPDDWPEYVLEHVKAFVKTLDTHKYTDRSDNREWVDKVFYLLPHASFGDYDNSSFVERANAKEFDEMFSFVSQRHGDYYSVFTGIDQDDLDAIKWDDLESLIETCNALEDYPIINEETMSELEIEAQNEAWKDWGLNDFRKELVKRFGEYYEDFIEALSDDMLTEVFYKAADKANEYWESEAGGGVYIRIERVVEKGITPEDLGLLPLDSEE